MNMGDLVKFQLEDDEWYLGLFVKKSEGYACWIPFHWFQSEILCYPDELRDIATTCVLSGILAIPNPHDAYVELTGETL